MARQRVVYTALFLCAPLCMLACAADECGTPADTVPVYGYEVVNAYPHDTEAFTQGLYYRNGFLYESTGLAGHSTLRKVVPETGEVLKIYHLPEAYFGEGLTVRNDTIYQLTYKNHVAFTYVEQDTFAPVALVPYPFTGWGLTHDDTSLISSDGSHLLRHLDPSTLEEVGRFSVMDGGRPQPSINEMEMISGRIYANIYGTEYIAIIAPGTGTIEGWLSMGGLRDSITTGGAMNGIAWDPENSRLFVTGKNWSHLFEVRVEPLHGGAPDESP